MVDPSATPQRPSTETLKSVVSGVVASLDRYVLIPSVDTDLWVELVGPAGETLWEGAVAAVPAGVATLKSLLDVTTGIATRAYYRRAVGAFVKTTSGADVPFNTGAAPGGATVVTAPTADSMRFIDGFGVVFGFVSL